MPKAPLPQEPAISVEDLDARILAVAHVDEVTINHDRMGSVELPWPADLHSPTKQRSAVLVELQHPRIPVAICNVNVAVSVPGNIGGLIEMQYIISGNPHSPQRKQHAPFRAKLQNHMRPISVVQIWSSGSTRPMFAVTNRSSAMQRMNLREEANSMIVCMPR